jgi:hypothetical protein
VPANGRWDLIQRSEGYNPVSCCYISFMHLEEQEDKDMAEIKKKKHIFANVCHKGAQKSTYPDKNL